MAAVAIVQTAFIGDVVLATPLLEAARVARPDDTVVIVVRVGCENIIENNPYTDKIIVWDKYGKDKGGYGIYRIGKLLKHYAVHTTLIPHRSLRTALAVYSSGSRIRVGFDRGGGSFLHTIRVPYRLGIHEVERNLMLARAAGWDSKGFKPCIFPDVHDKTIIDDVLHGVGAYCVFAPGSIWATKIWPVESYVLTGIAFAKRGLRIILSGGVNDEVLCQSLAKRIPDAITTAGILTLRQSAELYRRAEFVLTGDTAPQHLAAAVNARVFSIFGPTTRDFGFWPYTDRGVIIEENVDCRPCGVHGHKDCPERTHRCLRSITSEMVVNSIDKELG